MTLRYVDGFDYIPSGKSASERERLFEAGGWFHTSTGITPDVETGRFGFGKACLVDGINGTGFKMVRPYAPETGLNSDVGYFGFALFMKADSFSSNPYFGFYDGVDDAVQVCASFQNNGVVKAYRGPPGTGGTLLGHSWAGSYFDEEWMYIEMRAVIHDTGGEFQVRINTVPVIDMVSSDTKNTTHAWFDSIVFGTPSTGSTIISMLVDDIYLCDDAGSVNNSWLGNVRVKTQFPDAAGDVTQWTPTGAATNWQAALNTSLDDTKYNSSSTAGQNDLYGVESVVNASVVHGVQVRGAYRQDDATQRVSRNQIKSGVTTDDGADHYLNQTYTHYTDIWELNPDTGVGFTGSETNLLQIGPKVQS